jgi:erythromycin esterase
MLQGAHGTLHTTMPEIAAVGEDVAVTGSQVAPAAAPRPTIEPIDAARRAALVGEVRRELKPIRSADPAARDRDTEPILDAIGTARIAGLGEATHGTAEFFNLKDRIFRDLVRTRGFTVFAIEAPEPEAREMDRYVVTGTEDPRRALNSLEFSTWETQEVFALARWMRTYNASRGNRPALHFTGFDMQSAEAAVATIVTAVGKADAAAGFRVAHGIARVRQPDSELTAMSDAAWDACRASIDAIAPMVSRYTSNLDALHDFRIIQQFAEYRASPSGQQSRSASAMRDKDMADNVTWLANVRYPGQKLMLWAHNGHIKNERAFISTMGSILTNRFGKNYYRLGFAFSGGSIRAYDGIGSMRTFAVAPAPPDSFDGVLHSAGSAMFFLNLDRMPRSPLSTWLASPIWHRDIGGEYVANEETSGFGHSSLFGLAPLRTEYDGIIFVDRSHPSRALATP